MGKKGTESGDKGRKSGKVRRIWERKNGKDRKNGKEG
jgi:hypothetical protein